MKTFIIKASAGFYRYLARPVFFMGEPEKVHEKMTGFGQFLGKNKIAKKIVSAFWRVKNPALEQTVHGIRFENPIGLAAGFDYNTDLTQTLSAVGFGFTTVGSITNRPCEGNPPPRLGRLIKSRSLMVNKGFRNPGIKRVIEKLRGQIFDIPVGLSIGMTNSKELRTQDEAVQDILSAFKMAENSPVPFTHYELNISCPNLITTGVEFYSPKNLKQLLASVTNLKLKRPIFVKMPIDKTNKETLEMLKVIASFPVSGVIFGNLQKNRRDPALVPEEVARFTVGNFSGKPTEKRSNELIALAYKNFGRKLTIIGCGGTFSAEDAYKKIRLGATLVQLITGLVYQGPQLPAQINLGMVNLLERDNFKHIFEAVGTENR